MHVCIHMSTHGLTLPLSPQLDTICSLDQRLGQLILPEIRWQELLEMLSAVLHMKSAELVDLVVGFMGRRRLGPPAGCPGKSVFFDWEGSPSKIDYREKGTLILTALRWRT